MSQWMNAEHPHAFTDSGFASFRVLLCVLWTKTAVLNGFLIPGIDHECIHDLF